VRGMGDGMGGETRDANEVVCLGVVAHGRDLKGGSALTHGGCDAGEPMRADRSDAFHVDARGLREFEETDPVGGLLAHAAVLVHEHVLVVRQAFVRSQRPADLRIPHRNLVHETLCVW
jgi:hypothetical protein